MKKLGLFILMLFLAFTGCSISENFDTSLDGEIEKVILEFTILGAGQEVSPLGFIEINEYQVIEAVITITGPDNDVTTIVWTPGAPTTFLYEGVKTGIYTIELTETDESQASYSYQDQMYVRTGYNYNIAIVLGRNIGINIISQHIYVSPVSRK